MTSSSTLRCAGSTRTWTSIATSSGRALAEQAPWWLPGAVEDRIFDRLLDGARTLLDAMVEDPESRVASPARRTTAEAGERSRDVTRAAREGRADQARLVGAARVARVDVVGVGATSRPRCAPKPPIRIPILRQRLAGSFRTAGARLQDDPVLAAKVQEGIESAVGYVAEHFNGEIATLVSGTIERWDGEETSRRLELLLGPDLQYIRINGTVVGGLAGLALHTVATVLH